MLAATPVPQGYRLGPGDVVELRVVAEERGPWRLVVARDGTLPVPWLGPVPVSDLTTEAARDRLERSLAGGIYRRPQVVLDVVVPVAHRVRVLGGVARPGAYPVAPGDRLLDLLERAGGVDEENSGVVYLLPPQGEPTVVSLAALLREGRLRANVPVPSGATLFVGLRERVYVLGAVANPGSLEYRDGMTLMRAIAAAGGFDERADEEQIWLYRATGGDRIELDGEAILAGEETDPLLIPGDLVVVTQRFF